MGLHNRETNTSLVSGVLEDGTAPIGSVKTAPCRHMHEPVMHVLCRPQTKGSEVSPASVNMLHACFFMLQIVYIATARSIRFMFWNRMFASP